MMNLSIQNFTPFLVPPLVPLRIEEYQRKGGIETKQGPVGPFQVQKPLCVLLFLVCRKRLWSPRPSLSSKEQGQAVPNYGSEGMQKQRKSS